MVVLGLAVLMMVDPTPLMPVALQDTHGLRDFPFTENFIQVSSRSFEVTKAVEVITDVGALETIRAFVSPIAPGD